MTRFCTTHRRAYTLIELVVSISVATLLLGGLATAVVLASRALPEGNGKPDATIHGYQTAEQIASELLCALSFTERSATTVEFTVADRDNDCSPEKIRYAWSGTPGDPVIRRYNGGTPFTVIPDVDEFALTYDTTTLSETTPQETLLVYFSGWGDVTPTEMEHSVNATSWVSEYFEINLPQDVTELRFTRAEVMLRRGAVVPGILTLGIHRSKGNGSYDPDPAPIGTPGTIPGSDLSTISRWKGVVFSDVSVTDVARTDYCLVLKGTGAAPAYVQYLYANGAPDNCMVQRWTTDGGISWEPVSLLDEQDLQFRVYGYFSTTTEQGVTTERYFVTSVRIALRVGPDTLTRVETTTQVLNTPEVPTP